MRLIKYTTIGLRIPGYGAAEVLIDFAEELRHAETDPTSKIHESRCRSRWLSRPQSFARNDLPRWTSSAQLNAPKFEDWSQEETEWQERCARETAVKLAEIILKLKEKDKTTFFSPSENRCLPAPSTLKPRGKRICCRLQSVDAHDQQKGLEFCWVGNFTDVEKSYDGHNSEWWSADTWRGQSSCQRIGYILDNESPRGYASSFIARKALRWTLKYLGMDQRSKTTSWINGQKPHLIKKRYSDTVQHGELRSDRGSWFINEFFLKLALFNINDTFMAGNRSSYVFLKLDYLTNHDIFNCVMQ